MPMAAALKEWETRNGRPAAEEKEIRLYGGLMFGGSGNPADGNKDKTRKLINKLVRRPPRPPLPPPRRPPSLTAHTRTRTPFRRR